MTHHFDAAGTAALSRRLATALAPIEEGRASASPSFDESAFLADLAAQDFANPRPLEEVEDWVIRAFASGNVQMTHPGYVGLFNPAPFEAARRADLIAAGFNPQLAVRSHAIAAAEVEAHVVRAWTRRIGWGEGADGHFTSGGAEANATALQAALMHVAPQIAEEGMAAIAEPRFYISAESHLAWLKIAHQAGLGRRAVVLVPTDGVGRMDAKALADVIAGDRAAGRTPLMIAATAGTTNAGAVDPLHACADIAARERLWLHVDAAWGGALLASNRLRDTLDGIARADSVTLDAHKWLGATMGTGMFLTAHPEHLAKAFNVATSYMPSADAGVDPYLNGYQWSRRALGLRLYMVMAQLGWDGLAAHVEQAVARCDKLAARLEAEGWVRRNGKAMAVACMVPPDGGAEVATIVERVIASGQAWLSLARFEGEPVLRFCLTNGLTDEAAIERIAAAILEAAQL
ncbi:pyridoxal phosphate-dependent decarboxylase family protein [Sphingomicrobium arenosum]|uniref:pyridoxal phosphate-dependent decarboxylase family protein n=1 Tax=Sphingomicrobium arenosum TaxID=2233861 RepID=UPI002240F639|nr:pyridoxal-dependent decarboxylase [Sphingomicrobium arenosum]